MCHHDGMEEAKIEKTSGYGKKPLWQWVLLYVIIGVIVYGVLYYLLAGKYGGNTYLNSSPQSQYSNQQAAPSVMPSQAAITNQLAVPLSEENNSGESGKAILKEENGK